MALLCTVAGWIGAALIVSAYFLLSAKKIHSAGWLYHILNLSGSLGVAISSVYTLNWPSVSLQIVWSAIAIGALIWRGKANETR